MMNAHVTPQQALNFRGRSLLAFVLEPALPLEEWFAALDAWLVRSPTFFAAKPVILEMTGLDIELKAYRDLLGALARRHIRVMGVENASRALVGPHLPPVVSGGRTVSAASLVEADAPPSAAAPAKAAPPAEPMIVDGNVRSGQSIMHPDGRRDDRRPRRLRRRDRRGRLRARLRRPAGARDRRHLGRA